MTPISAAERLRQLKVSEMRSGGTTVPDHDVLPAHQAAYLSVDLDFWINCNAALSDWADIDEDMLEFFDRLAACRLKPTVKLEHHELLDSMNNAAYSHIYHVDYHSDLAIADGQPLAEGNFFYFLKNRRQMEYRWFLPNLQQCHLNRLGHCDDQLDLCAEHNWLFSKQSVHLGTTQLPWETVVSAGVSLSPNWVYYGVAEEVIEKYLFKWADNETKQQILEWRDEYYRQQQMSLAESKLPRALPSSHKPRPRFSR